MYLADRECIKQTGWSISGDSYRNLPYGPVLTNLYTLIQGKHPDLRIQSKWDSCFLTDAKSLKAKVQIIPGGGSCPSLERKFWIPLMDSTIPIPIQK